MNEKKEKVNKEVKRKRVQEGSTERNKHDQKDAIRELELKIERICDHIGLRI